MRYFIKIKIFLIVIYGVISNNHMLMAQVSEINNIILIDVNTIINPKNCNEVVSDKLLLTTENRCFQDIKKLINREPNEDFMVVYLFDNADGQTHFYRIFRASDAEYIKDSLNDYRKIPTYNFLDYSVRATNLLEQINTWGTDLQGLSKANIHYFSGCDSFAAKDIEFDYINRIIRLTGLIDKNTLKLKSTHKFVLHYNGGTNQSKRKNDLYEYVTTSF